MMEVVQTHIIPTDDLIDDDVLKAMNSLGCFKDKEKLKQELLQPLHNTGRQAPNILDNFDFSSHLLVRFLTQLSTYFDNQFLKTAREVVQPIFIKTSYELNLN